VTPAQLADQILITYPVDLDRLDIYTQFLMPANVVPKRHKVIETTDIMLQMVASGRGVAALPRWLAEEYGSWMQLTPVRLGKKGIAKQIYLGTREADQGIDYLTAFVELAREADTGQARIRA
jgi:LysR family transcriptional regulator for metE and metH